MGGGMNIKRQQNFNLEFFEIENGMRIGIAGFLKDDPGPSMFYPESGKDYILVIFDSGWYKFHIQEFTHEAGLEYISEKLHCTLGDAKIIRSFINDLFVTDAAKSLLSGEPYTEYKLKNPYLM
jgi:hypothetical protein